MEILVLPFLAIILWVVFFFVFINKKATEDKPEKSFNGFWPRFLVFALGFSFVGDMLFKVIRINGLFPSFIESSVLTHAGGIIGFLFGAVYVLVTYETKKN